MGCAIWTGKLVIRDDDSEAVIRERLDAYDRQTRPRAGVLTGHLGRRVVQVDADDDPPETMFQKICQTMESA